MSEPATAADDRRPLRLAELPWTRAAEEIRRDPRLIVPVGALLQHGPHLPLETDTVVVTRLAEELSRRHRVLVAPTLPFGAGSEADQAYAGSACVRGKTLHRTLNELVSRWESHGVEEFVLMTSHGYGPHLQALATVASEAARVRAVDLHAVDLSEFLESHQGGEHGGEMATSLMLHLAPERVEMEAVEDADLPLRAVAGLRQGEEPVAPAGSVGVVGFPSRASAEKGRRIFEHVVSLLGRNVLEREAGVAGG